MMRTINIHNLHDLFIYRSLIKKVILAGLALCLVSCDDKIVDTKKSDSKSNNDFKLTLTISDDIIRLDDSIKITAEVKRKVHKDSINSSVTMKMIIDAVGGNIDGHSFSLASSITVSMDDEPEATFQALAFFLPDFKYSTSKKEYYDYMEKGHISATFDGISVTMPVSMVVPQ